MTTPVFAADDLCWIGDDTGREREGVIVLASENGKSLFVFFDGLIDSLIGGMPVSVEAGEAFNVLSGHRITLRRRGST